MTGSDPAHTAGLTPSGPAKVEPVRVEATSGPGAGPKLRVERGSVTVGSAGECDLVLDDRAVSRYHASIELLPGAVRVVDLGSRNGTFYLGARIQDARVPIGATVRVGQTTLRIEPGVAHSGAPASEKTELAGVLGQSKAMREAFAAVERLAPTDATVLIEGETGVGKEAIARALHALSPRSHAPFIVFDCAAVNPNLMESELFGHEAGAFTGAVRPHDGALTRAQDGTLVFDNVSSLPLSVQPRLLRVLESRSYQPVGSGQVRQTLARFIVTSPRSLEEAVKAGEFRADLLFRVGTATVHLPPLRERREDIEVLATHFGRQLKSDFRLRSSTLAALLAYEWPGNARELRNAIERLLALESVGLPSESGQGPSSFNEAREKVMDQFERAYIQALLSQTDGNVSAAARLGKMARSQFYRLLEKYRLVPSGESE